ncbi:hypothetical protein CRENBAI_016375 [Crenichthys baileyi]|uniref:Uncharacterized protein n=1 Tax=Crenichthys baileyi TaxID=28760 RepID=A0AAV9R3Y0_9TELE
MDLGENQVNGQRLGAAAERQQVELGGENDWHQLTPSPTQGEAPMDGKEKLEAGEHTTIRTDQSECLEEALDENPSLETSVGAQPRREQKEEGAPSLQEHSFASVVTAKDCGDMLDLILSDLLPAQSEQGPDEASQGMSAPIF